MRTERLFYRQLLEFLILVGVHHTVLVWRIVRIYLNHIARSIKLRIFFGKSIWVSVVPLLRYQVPFIIVRIVIVNQLLTYGTFFFQNAN